MTFHEFTISIFHARSALLVAGVLGLCGCATVGPQSTTVGPQSITAGRGVLGEVINRTEDEQILNVIVRLRYDETFGMMSVASVTDNLSFSAQAGANIGVGEWLEYYNNERTHQGKMCCGRTPMQTLEDGKQIWKEKFVA